MSAKAQVNGDFVFNPVTSPQTAGVSFTITIMEKVDNVTNSGFAGIATLSVSTGTITPTSTGAFSSGVWTGSVIVTGAGSSVTITATSSGVATGTSNSFTVASGALAHFGIVVPGSVTAGSSFGGVDVTAYDAYGNVKTDYAGSIYFASSDSQATLPYTSSSKYTFVSGDNGAHAFSGFTLKTAPSQTITVIDGSVSNQSTSITVTAGAATQFVVSGFSSPVVAGAAGSVTVTAKDAYGNTATGYTGTVKFTSSDSQAVLPASYTFKASDAGVHSFSVTLETAGSQSITATDSVTSSITGSQTGITVNAAGLDHFVVGVPGSAAAGSAFTLSVTAKDFYGNTITSYSSSVGLSASSGILSPSSTGTSGWSSGVWSSSSVTLSVVGSITITAKAGSAVGTATLTVTAGAATQFVVSGFSSPVVAGAAGSVTVTAKDAYGNTATGYVGTVKFTSSDSQAVLPASAGLTGGVGSFSVTLETAGSQSITATDSVTSSITGSQTGITVNAASAASLVVSGFPSTTIAGVAHPITVTAVDAYNNTVTGYSGTVKITSSDSKAVLPANSGLSSGTGSFSVTLKTAGSQSITATDTATNSIGGFQTGITVTAGAATQFVVSGFPNPVVAGAAGSVTVTAKDAYGNTATGYVGTVKFTSSDSQAVLPANSGLSSGTGSFSVTFETVGSQSITATDTLTSSIVGSQTGITVTVAGAASFVVSEFPVSTIAGVAHTVTVTAVDAYNNTVTGYSGTVKITSSDSKAVLPANAKLTGGVGSFSVTLKTAGSQSITATDSATISITSSQTGITVSAASGDYLVVSGFPSPTVAGVVHTFTVTAYDASGNVATGYAGTVAISSSDSEAVLSSNAELTDGVGYFSVILLTAGSQSIMANDTVNSSISGFENDITVNAAALNNFVFDTISSQVAGSAFNITVTAVDAYGNTVTGYTGSPSLTYSAGSITPGTMKAFVKGVGLTFVTVTAAGSGVTITATDGSQTGTSNAFTVTLAPTSTPTAAPTTGPKATPTPTSKSSPTPTGSATTVPATTGTGAKVNLGVSGNVTSSQISDAEIASYSPTKTTTLSFTMAAANGTSAFGNMTIPKTAISYGASPEVYIDGLAASYQGYTQDGKSFYVWFTAGSGVHHVSIQFVVVSSISSGFFSEPVFAVGITVPEIVSVFTVIAVRRLRRSPDEA